MKQKQPLATRGIFSAKLARRMMIGTIIGLVAISLFIFRVPYPKAAWGEFWRIRPLIVTPLAGALCGACHYLIDYLLNRQGRMKSLITMLIAATYVLGIWIGIILGLAGTLWD